MRIQTRFFKIKRLCIISTVPILLPVLGMPSAVTPSYGQDLEKQKELVGGVCGEAKIMATELYSLWEGYKAGTASRLDYDRAYVEFKHKKQQCLAGKKQLSKATISSKSGKVVKTIVGKSAGYVLRSVHPSYLGALGFGQVMDREGATMRSHWRSIRKAIDNVDNVTSDGVQRKQGPFSFLSDRERNKTKTDFKNIDYLTELISKGLPNQDKNDAQLKIEKLQKRINARFILHDKVPLFQVEQIGRWPSNELGSKKKTGKPKSFARKRRVFSSRFEASKICPKMGFNIVRPNSEGAGFICGLSSKPKKRKLKVFGSYNAAKDWCIPRGFIVVPNARGHGFICFPKFPQKVLDDIPIRRR